MKTILAAILLSLMFLPAPGRSAADPNPTGRLAKDSTVALTLEEAIELALKQNRSLRRAVTSRQNQRLSLDSARSTFNMKITPSSRAGVSQEDVTDEQFSVGLSFSKKFETGVNAAISPGLGYTDNEYTGDATLSLSIPLMRGFGREVNLDPIYSAEHALRDTDAALHISQVNTVLETVAAVYDIIENEELVRIYASQAGELDRQARLARVRGKVNLASSMDVYRAAIRAQDAHNDLTTARKTLQAARDHLKLILALSPARPIRVTAPQASDPPVVSETEAIRIALDNRIDLRRAESLVAEAERRAAVFKHNIKPGVDLVVKYRLVNQSEDIEKSFNFDESRYSVNLVSSTDWSRSTEKINYLKSRNDVENARLDYQTRTDEIRRQVRQQLAALRAAEERTRIRSEQIHQARGKRVLSGLKYRHNLADNFDLIEAASELNRARIDQVRVRTDYQVGIYKLRAVLGTLLAR